MVGYMSTASTLSIQHVIHKENLSDFPVSSGYDKLRFLKPVALGDTITVIYEVIRIDKERATILRRTKCSTSAATLWQSASRSCAGRRN